MTTAYEDFLRLTAVRDLDCVQRKNPDSQRMSSLLPIANNSLNDGINDVAGCCATLPKPDQVPDLGDLSEDRENKVRELFIETDSLKLSVSPSNSLVEIPLVQSEEEEDEKEQEDEIADHLSPLMMDNHTVVEHHECFQNEPKLLRNSETCSSIDSDISMSYDQRQVSSAQQTDAHNSSDDNAKDSGCEVSKISTDDTKQEDEGPFEVPNDEFCEKIVEQVEFYFSNESILKDAFLLKHVRRNKEGLVSLKLVSSFKRVRQLTKDWRVVGYAIKQKSNLIELNDIGTKIRRIESLPCHDETMPSRTVVATDLGLDKITIEKVFELFSNCGEIALVRIMRVGGPIPADVRQFINKYPDLLQKECALVEFVESQSARNALQFEDMTVLEMVAPKKKTGKKANVTKLFETHQQIVVEGGDSERSRGGAPIDFAPRFQFRRTNSAFYAKPDQVIYVPPPRKHSFNNNNQHMNMPSISHGVVSQQNFDPNYHRRVSTSSLGSAHDLILTDGYPTERRSSQCSTTDFPRRQSTECSCNCSRRPSQNDLMFRRVSQCSNDSMRKLSIGSNFERRTSIGGSETNWRQPEVQPERKLGIQHYHHHHQPPQSAPLQQHFQHPSPHHYQTHIQQQIIDSPIRKYSNGFDPLRKLSNADEYINGRRISTDSGYDRKLSFSSYSSDCSARSRSGSFICSHNPTVEQIVRNPVGPNAEGGKGFGARTRKIGQILPPI